MVVWFSTNLLVLTALQAACIALPSAGLPLWLERYRAPGWALVAPLSIVVVVFGIELAPSTADVLTWVALVGVPIGCAVALAWAMRGARPGLAALAAPLLALAWALPEDRVGELATTLLIAGSVIALGRLLAAASPLILLKAGVIALAVVDAALVFSGSLEQPNAVLVAASPGPGLPELQSASFATAGMGYGDFFAAAVVGAILAREGRPQLIPALGMLVVAFCWDQLFLVYDLLPATIPPALVLIGVELWARRAALARAVRA